MTSPSQRDLARANELMRKEQVTDTIAPLASGFIAMIWLPVGLVLGWAVLYAVTLTLNRAAYRTWVTVGAHPAEQRLASMAFVLAAIYTALPWALVLHDQGTATMVGMVMVFAGALRAAQNFSLGRTVGVASIVPYLGPAVTPPLLGLFATPDLAHLAAFISTSALFIYLSAMGIQQVALRRKALDEADRAEAERRSAPLEKRRLESILETPLISLAMLDKDLRFRAASARFCARLGIDRSTVVGKTLREALPWAPDHWLDASARSLAGERVGQSADHYRLPSGEVTWSPWENAPWYDENGEIVGVVTYGIDVTEIMLARSQAETSANLLSLALEVGRSAVYEIDVVRQEIAFDLHSERIFGRPVRFSDLDVDANPGFFDEDKPALKKTFAAAARGELERSEHRLRHAQTGEPRWIRCGYRAQKDPATGRTVRVLVMATDVTERREREARAAEAAAAAEAKAAEERLARQREENLRRMLGQANASPGPATGTGTAAQAAAPSAAYQGRVKAAILPNIVYTGKAPSRAVAEVEVTLAPGGTVIARRLVKRSGHPDWDEAVLRAIDRTPRIPADADGRVPPALLISFRPDE